MIRFFRIATGKARRDGRQPSHDGEYITIYYNDNGDSELIAEHNAGTFCLDDEDSDEQDDWTAIKAEAYDGKRDNVGEPLRSCGYAARNEMIELGWATKEQFDGGCYSATA